MVSAVPITEKNIGLFSGRFEGVQNTDGITI